MLINELLNQARARLITIGIETLLVDAAKASLASNPSSSLFVIRMEKQLA